jgi:hypothetical protein
MKKSRKEAKINFPAEARCFFSSAQAVFGDPLVKRPGREADQLTPPRTEVTNTWSYPDTIPYICISWCLFNVMENITF